MEITGDGHLHHLDHAVYAPLDTQEAARVPVAAVARDVLVGAGRQRRRGTPAAAAGGGGGRWDPEGFRIISREIATLDVDAFDGKAAIGAHLPERARCVEIGRDRARCGRGAGEVRARSAEIEWDGESMARRPSSTRSLRGHIEISGEQGDQGR